MDRVWDSRGEARAALERAVTGFGAAVLGQADMLEGLLQDDIPQLPREVAMLTETARYGVAAMLGERVRQGISAPSAVTMAATEMTSRTAVDSAGALWAAGVFAHVIGLGAGGPTTPPARQVQAVAEVTLPPPLPITTQQQFTREATGPQTGQLGQTHQLEQTHQAGQPGWPGQFGQIGKVGQLADQGASALHAAGAGATGLAVAAAAGTAVTVVLLSFWVLTGFSRGEDIRNWLEVLPLLAGGIGFAIWALRTSAIGTGLAAALGLCVPAASFAIYNAAIAAELTAKPAIERYFIVGTSVLAVLTAVAAAITAAGAIGRRQLFARQKQDGLSITLSVFGLAFVVCSLFGQLTIDGQLVGNVEGPGVPRWFAIWGLFFLALYSIPPIIALFIKPGSPARLALWSGWLVVVLAWQISDSPVEDLRPAYGLFLTWGCWLAVLICTMALGARRSGQPAPQLAQNPWQRL